MTTSRYAGQATISAPQDDGSTRALGVPRIAPALPEALRYTARAGDRLDLIANVVYRDPAKWRYIAEYNGLLDPLVLRPGQLLTIPFEEEFA